MDKVHSSHFQDLDTFVLAEQDQLQIKDLNTSSNVCGLIYLNIDQALHPAEKEIIYADIEIIKSEKSPSEKFAIKLNSQDTNYAEVDFIKTIALKETQQDRKETQKNREKNKENLQKILSNPREAADNFYASNLSNRRKIGDNLKSLVIGFMTLIKKTWKNQN